MNSIISMALIGHKDLEERMYNTKKKLDHPFQRIEDLLRTLEELETYLGKIDQSDSYAMKMSCPLSSDMIFLVDLPIMDFRRQMILVRESSF